MMPCTVLLVFLYSFVFHTPTMSENPTLKPSDHNMFNHSLYATCRMRPNNKLESKMPKVYGYLLFKQTWPENGVKVLFRLRGLPTSDTQARAIHIHQYGDLSEGCTSTGGHYNPHKVNHPDHPGDFGNFIADNGKIRESVDSKVTLYGTNSILGRAVVMHEKEDDMGKGGDDGSLQHGNAGQRLACCVIGISNSKFWKKRHQ